MTKDEIANHVSNQANVNKNEAKRMLNVLLHLISVELRNGRAFALQDIGTLKVKQMAERTGRNPRTGQEIKIPARKAVKLQVSQTLSDQINA